MEPEYPLIFLIGFVFGMLMLMVASTNHKENCDQFGATRFGSVVYDCHPKAK